jgi:probable HAF family extracellular repeat protein
MKSRTFTLIAAMTLFAVLAMPVPLAAQQQPQEKKQHHHYKLIDLGTFGGSASYVNPVGNGGPYINREGEVVGSSMTAIPPRSNGNFPCPAASGVFHAMAWLDGHVTDLDSLGDPRNCANALAINDTGEMVGASENGLVDPATGSVQLRAVRWRDGEIKNLGTFGGNHSYASAINNRGQIVGFALNKIPDPLSMFAVVLGGPSTGTQTRAFLWEKGEMRDLGTLGGPDAWGIFVNESGEVAGYSYTNSTANATTGFPTVDPFLWKNGRSSCFRRHLPREEKDHL